MHTQIHNISYQFILYMYKHTYTYVLIHPIAAYTSDLKFLNPRDCFMERCLHGPANLIIPINIC